MKLIADADRFVNGAELKVTAALRLAARLEKAATAASRTDAGLFDLARDRVLNHLLRAFGDVVRVGTAQEGAHLVVIRPPRGKRAPRALIAVERIEEPLRAGLRLDLATDEEEEESVPGLQVRPIDPAFRARFAQMAAGDLAAAARAAEEEYDYDRAVAAWRLSVLRSGGSLDRVRELVRFLSDYYADYEEISELLSSEVIDVGRERDLHLRLADALYQLNQLDEAYDQYESLLASGKPELVVVRRLGRMDLDANRLALAEQRLQAAGRLDPGDVRARTLLERCRSARGDVATALLEEAKAARAAGDGPRARAICADMAKRGLAHPGLDGLRADLDADDARAEAAGFLDDAQVLADIADWRHAAHALREAHQLDPSLVESTAALTTRVHAALAAEDCATHSATALERAAKGDPAGALMAFQRAISTGVPLPPPADEHPLLATLRGYHERRGGAPDHHVCAALAALHQAQQHHAAGEHLEAEAALRTARRHLRDDAEVTALAASLRAVRQRERQARAQADLERATALEAEGALQAALDALEAAVRMAGGEVADSEVRRARLRAALDRSETLTRLTRRLEKHAAGAEWWQVRRVLAETPLAEEPDIRPYADRASAAIQQSWQVTRLADPASTPGRLDLSSLGLEGTALLYLESERADTVLVGAGHVLAIVNPTDLAVRAIHRLPEGVRLDTRTSRLFIAGSRVLVFDGETRTLTVLGDLDAGELRVEDRLQLRGLPGTADPAKLATETLYDATSGRLLTLLTGQRGRFEGRLLSMDLTDGQVRNEEGFNHAVFNLRHIVGTDQYTVQRLLNARRLTPNFYNFAVIDARTRVRSRRFYPDFGEPMHALRRISYIPNEKAPFVLQYWFLDPFSGQVLDHSNGFAQLKEDWSVYYQVSDPDTWMRDDRTLMTAFAVHAPTSSLIFHWRRYGSRKDAPPAHGVAGFALDGLNELWSTDTPTPEDKVTRVYDHRASDSVLALLDTAEGPSLRVVDPENHTL